MIGAQRIGLDPALPFAALVALAIVVALGLGIYVWRGGAAPILRGLGLAFLFLALMQPQWVRETREPADDVALVLVDQSESLGLSGRREAARAAGDAIAERLTREQGLEVRVRETRGGADG